MNTEIPPAEASVSTPQESAAAPTSALPAAPEGPVQVDAAVFLAARLRESVTEAANLRTLVAELQTELARLRAQADQVEISKLDSTYNVGAGSILQARTDGTYWRIPRSAGW